MIFKSLGFIAVLYLTATCNLSTVSGALLRGKDLSIRFLEGDDTSGGVGTPSITDEANANLLAASWTLVGKYTFDEDGVDEHGADEYYGANDTFYSCHEQLEEGYGVCSNEYFCLHLDEANCEMNGGNYSLFGTCEELGFIRFLEYSPTGEEYIGAPALRICIRESVAEADDSVCQIPVSTHTDMFGAVCIEGGLSTGEGSSCSTGGLTSHVLIPNSDYEDVSTCMALVNKDGFGIASAMCPVQPPTYGECDEQCQTYNLARKAALKVIGYIPEVGGHIAKIVSYFFKQKEGESFTDRLKKVVDYIDARIDEAKDEVLLKVALAKWATIGRSTEKLQDYIEKNNTDPAGILERIESFNTAEDACDEIVEQMKTFEALSLTPYMSQIGQACISLASAKAYHYEYVTGKPPVHSSISIYKKHLDELVGNLTVMADKAKVQAQEWRAKSAIYPTKYNKTTPIYTTFYKGNFCGVTSGLSRKWYHYWRAFDKRCYTVGGPRPYYNAQISFFQNCGAGKSMDAMNRFAKFYDRLAKDSFTDTFIGDWFNGVVSLWKYQTSAMVDAGVRPSPKIRLATSMLPDYYLPNTEEPKNYHDNANDHERIMANFDGEYGGDRNARLDKIEMIGEWKPWYKGDGDTIQVPYTKAIRLHQTIGGQARTTTIGEWDRTPNPGGYPDILPLHTLELGPNEVVTAIGVEDCDHYETNTQMTDHTKTIVNAFCLNTRTGFKTSIVDLTTGAFVSEGRTWTPAVRTDLAGADSPDIWMSPPNLAHYRNDTYVPRLLSLAGWFGKTLNLGTAIQGRVPVWMYENLE